MKAQLSAQLLTASAIALGAIASIYQPSLAQTRTYFCDTSNDGTPTTFARNVTGKRIPVILWKTDLGGEYTPKKRCEEVSARFENAHAKGTLNYLTTGVKAGQQVVCASKEYGGPCGDLLFTLQPGQNGSVVTQHLVDIGYRARGPVFQTEDGNPQIYIDMNKLIGETPVKR